ncbi:hypothetical protein ACFQHW_09040 [Lapidilactobacillus achengensis]|uniref:Uncharacterized protein n=1 Tax=Lapidilactobacillus achengensis TaxID=2486000 RepID=A0ABW1URU2_9LACO|nr:hypothetical protein [Lapidilactobacillus achengensis]
MKSTELIAQRELLPTLTGHQKNIIESHQDSMVFLTGSQLQVKF